MFQIFNKTQNASLGDRIEEARSFSKRLFGLIFKKNFIFGEGLLFPRCKSIHTMGMKYAIDVLLLDRKNQVLRVFCDLKPYRLTRPCLRSNSILEIPAGTIMKTKTQCGDQLEIRKA